MQENKLSLWAAVLINVNIMLGVGIFINTTVLAKLGGLLGFLSYLIVGILMLPLILSKARLVEAVPSGSFYAYGKTFLSPFCGFVSSWSYFWGKLASCTLMVHTFATLLQIFIPATKTVPTVAIDCFIIVLFVGLNMLNLKTGTKIQVVLFSLKIIPILFVIIGGFAFYNNAHLTIDNALWTTFPATLALVLYAFSGFEATCSLSGKIQNAKKNAPRAILISYAIVVSACLLYQFAAFASVGMTLGALDHFSSFYNILANMVTAKIVAAAPYIKMILYVAMAASSLGGAYGIMFSNNWNMYYIANDNRITGCKFLKSLNTFSIPYLCVVFEGLVCLMYTFITLGNQLPLQQTAAFGCIIAYTISVIAFLKGIFSKQIQWSKTVALLALINCLILITSTVYSFLVTANAFSFILFSSIMLLGIMLFIIKNHKLAQF